MALPILPPAIALGMAADHTPPPHVFEVLHDELIHQHNPEPYALVFARLHDLVYLLPLLRVAEHLGTDMVLAKVA